LFGELSGREYDGEDVGEVIELDEARKGVRPAIVPAQAIP
jgi:hypothetical protein